MALLDISIPWSDTTPTWPGDTPYSCGWTCRREDGESVNLGAVTTSLHVGTHADAPLHVHSDWPASETLPVSVFMGEATVVALPDDLPRDAEISLALLRELLGPHVIARVLVRTGRSIASGVFPDAWPALSVEAARWLVDSGVVLWGTDAPSVDLRESKDLAVHHALFGGGLYVLENLSLADVEPGVYELLAQPLAVHGADAAPVRAVLRGGQGR